MKVSVPKKQVIKKVLANKLLTNLYEMNTLSRSAVSILFGTVLNLSQLKIITATAPNDF